MLLLLLLAAATPAGDVVETRLETAIQGEGSLEATVHYRVVLFEELQRLPFALLEADGTTVEAIEAVASETRLEVSLEPSHSPQRHGAVALAGPRRGALDLQIRYSVSSAVTREGDELVARLPIPVLALPPRAARAEAFIATLVLPRGFDLVESFPAGFARRDDGYFGALPLVPAFVFARAAPGGKLVTFERAVDWGVLALLGLGTLGLKRGLGMLSP